MIKLINLITLLEENTCYKIIQLIKDVYNIQNKIVLNINKKINIGAGLGGGSSNAATILKYLNTVFDLNLSQQKKEILSQKVGMDVAFFINGNF